MLGSLNGFGTCPVAEAESERQRKEHEPHSHRTRMLQASRYPGLSLREAPDYPMHYLTAHP